MNSVGPSDDVFVMIKIVSYELPKSVFSFQFTITKLLNFTLDTAADSSNIPPSMRVRTQPSARHPTEDMISRLCTAIF